MPPPNDPRANAIAEILYAEQTRRLHRGFTLDAYPASHSDLVYCALALIDAGYLPDADLRAEVLRLRAAEARAEEVVNRLLRCLEMSNRVALDTMIDALSGPR